MGNQLAFCCKTHQKAEGTEINRSNFNDYSEEKHREKFSEQIDKTKSSIILKNDEPLEIIKNKSQDIFENTTHFFAVISSNIKKEEQNDFSKSNYADFGDEAIEKEQELQARYTSLYQSYVPKAKEKPEKNGQENFLEKQSALLKDFFVSAEGSSGNENLEAFMGENVLVTRRKHGLLKDDAYLKPYFEALASSDKTYNNNKNTTEINTETENNHVIITATTQNNNKKNESTASGNITLPAVYIDKVRKDEVYSGNWHLTSNIQFTAQTQNLKSIMKFSGLGIHIKQDKSVAEGFFREGELSGPGRVILANGDLFKGLYTNGFLNESGIFVDFSGNIYNGQFKLNIMDGYGEEIFIDNSTFKGEYKRNKKNGKGKFVWADGSFYEGELQDNNLHGKGVYQWASGLKYEGDWARGVMQGKGIFTNNNGEYYEGEFKDNKKDGFGLFWWSEKKYYLGYWQDGVQHGFGKYIKDGKLMIGVWSRGKFDKHLEKEQIKFPNLNFKKRVAF